MDTNSKPDTARVLFVCTHNSGRSQMAEAFLNILGHGRFFAESAGLEPREIDPLVLEVMSEEGIDLSRSKAKRVIDFFKEGRLYDYVIYVCDRETEDKCPVFPGIRKTLRWGLPDPSAITGSRTERLQGVRGIKNQVKDQVIRFIMEFHP